MGRKKDKKAPKIYIELDNPYRSYFAGQLVDGRVVIRNKKAKKVKEVTILLEGKCRVRWTAKESCYSTVTSDGQRRVQAHQPVNRVRIVEYSSEENYISLKTSLAGDGDNLITLPEGITSYPFRFALPSNLPSSFTSKEGLVSYLVEAEIKELKQPLLKKQKKTCVPFTVNGIFDLNLEAAAGLPQIGKKMKGSNFFACRRGQFGFILHLHHRSGFVPGEILDFRVEITNGSNRKVNGVKASLLQVTAFYAEGETKLVKGIVTEVKGPEVDEGEHEMWTPANLVIPSLPPTRLGGGCRLIDVRYFLFFEMKVSGLSDSLTGQLPVMIGTIPLRATFVEFRPATHMPVMPTPPQFTPEPVASTSTSPEIMVSPAPLFPDYPDLPPPSYSEAVADDGFHWSTTNNLEGETEKENSGKGIVDDNFAINSPPSAPPIDEYVPNYITYCRKN